MNTLSLVAVAAIITTVTAPTSRPDRAPALKAASPLAEALSNDNRVPAGRLANGVLTLALEAREVLWYPEDKPGAAIPLYAFAEVGQAARIPGPMIRVPAGTEIHATVHNTLPRPLRLRGLQDRASGTLDSTVVAPGATEEFRFRVDIPGTYYYWARTSPTPAVPGPGNSRDSQLIGAFIVDPAGTRPRPGERTLVITVFNDTVAALGIKSEQADRELRRDLILRDHWFLFAVNGRSWPHTERLAYSVGDTVRWRVINAAAIHPMHLHGFYFDVLARGDAQRDTLFTPVQRRKAVTERMIAGSTMAMSWVPTRPGNWLFHCHLVEHIAEALRLPQPPGHETDARPNHAMQGMAGLVLGIQVAPPKGATVAVDPPPRRKLRVYVTQRERVYGDQPGLSFVLQEGSTPPADDSLRIPGSTIILHQHEPTEVTVINRARQMATIHWHGIEVQSYYDGVGDWSGWGTRTAPMIAPGDSFVVRLLPDRAGTFIYHTHTDEATQLVSGLYGTLLVVPEHAAPDTTERVFLFGIGGPQDDAPPTVNGAATPPPIELRAGTAHRFRFINISPLESRTVRLLEGSVLQEWRALAKDGADLPPSQATQRPATVVLAPGETIDFEVLRPQPGTLSLEITSPQTVAIRWAARQAGAERGAIPLLVTKIPVNVR